MKEKKNIEKLQNNQKTINKMEINVYVTYMSIITLNINDDLQDKSKKIWSTCMVPTKDLLQS